MNFRSARAFLTAGLLLVALVFTSVSALAALSQRTIDTMDTAVVTFEYYDSTGFVVTDVSIYVSRGKTVDNIEGEHSSQVLNVMITVCDKLTGYYPEYRIGSTDTFQFTCANNLSSAHVTGMCPVQNLYTGEYTDFDVDLQWDANGRLVRYKDNYVQHQPGELTIIERDSRVSQPTICSGTVFEGATNWAPSASDIGGLQHEVMETTASRLH